MTAAAASVVAGVALVPNWSAGASVTDDPTVDAATKATFQRLADAVFTDRTQALVAGTGKADTRHASGFSGSVRLSGGQTREEKTALDELRDRRGRLARLGEKYRAGSTKVTLDATQVKGRRAKVAVTETTTLTYDKATGKSPKSTGFQAHHELTFQADRNGTWQLTGIRDTDDGYLAVNQVAKPAVTSAKTAAEDDGPPSAARAATSWPAPAKAKNFSATGYDYKAMVAYAQKYWNNYNPAYPDFNGQGAGGDCTNFVSQALKAGGWKARTRLRVRLPQVVRELRDPVPLVRRRQRVLLVRPSPRSGPPASPTSTRWTSATCCRWTSTATGPRTTR